MLSRKKYINLGSVTGSCIMALSLCACTQQTNNNRPNYASTAESSAKSSAETSTTALSETSSPSLSQDDLVKAAAKYQGEYKKIGAEGVTLIINGLDVNFIIESEIDGKHKDLRFINYLSFDNDGRVVVVFPSGEERYKAILNGDTLVFNSAGSGNTDMSFTKTSDNTVLPPEKIDPELGMTKEEVTGSTWAGEPNKTELITTENGTAEMWYYKWGEIVFVDDVVTIINEGAVNSSPDSNTDSQDVNDGYIHIGDSFVRGNILFTFMAYDNNCTEYAVGFAPKDGYKYIRLKLNIKNIGNKSDNIYSTFFNCYADNNQAETLSGLEFKDEDGIIALSNKLSPNREANCSLYYEIPKNSKSVEVEYSSDAFQVYYVLKCQ